FSVTLPFGVYAQNYVLKKAQGTHFAASATTTTIMLALEIVLLMLVLAIMPIAGWPQLQATLWGIIGACIVVALATHWLPLQHYIRRLATRPHRVGWFARGTLDFLQHLRTITRAHVLLHNALLTAAYMLALVIAFQC